MMYKPDKFQAAIIIAKCYQTEKILKSSFNSPGHKILGMCVVYHVPKLSQVPMEIMHLFNLRNVIWMPRSVILKIALIT